MLALDYNILYFITACITLLVLPSIICSIPVVLEPEMPVTIVVAHKYEGEDDYWYNLEFIE